MNYRLPTINDYDILKEYVEEHYSNYERSISASVGLTEMNYKDCVNMLNDNGTLIIKNQWSLLEKDKEINKIYSAKNSNMYYCIYRTLENMKNILEQNGLSCDSYNIYPDDLNNYFDTHEYALICRRKK